ncbi:transposase [Methylobacterium oryzae]|uniref:Transposase n=1 Tax=Methylobacterium oryzae TaxID=334852 RepID=A0ABU7TUF0_9HYPH
MTDRMVSSDDPPRAERVEVITSVQPRRPWTTQEKVRLVEESYLPSQSVSLVARRHWLNANQLFTWRRLMEQGAFTAVAGRCWTRLAWSPSLKGGRFYETRLGAPRLIVGLSVRKLSDAFEVGLRRSMAELVELAQAQVRERPDDLP